MQAERGKQYDAPYGTRSMAKSVQAFNAITGRDLTKAKDGCCSKYSRMFASGKTLRSSTRTVP